MRFMFVFLALLISGCEEIVRTSQVNLEKSEGKVKKVEVRIVGKLSDFNSIFYYREDLEKKIIDIEDLLIDLKKIKEQMPINEKVLEYKNDN